MTKWILLPSASAILLFAAASASAAAFAQSIGDPCTGTDRQYTTSGTSTSALICNGATLELLEKDLSNPVRKGIGTVTPTATLDINGEARLGNTGLGCSGTTEGALRYNGTSKQPEYCNGSSWLQLVSGGGLKVYKGDGVTELGNLVGSYDVDCEGLIYADNSGVVFHLDKYACAGGSTNFTVYFSGANCTGTPVINDAGYNYIGYCCTGSSSCTTKKCTNRGDATSSLPVNSKRNAIGVCSTDSSVIYGHIALELCSEDGSPCLVK